jgi:hypothetical protein
VHIRAWNRVSWGAVVAATAAIWCAGCSGDARPELHLSVGAAAQFHALAGPPRTVGYQMAVVIMQVETNWRPTCPSLPSDLVLLANDQEVPATTDPTTGCLNTSTTWVVPPPVGTVTVDAKLGTDVIAHAEFDGLAPGSTATLASPANGQVTAGDEVVVVPTPGLPTGEASLAYFYPLDDMTVGASLYPPQAPVREADGVHVVVPAFSGRAAVTCSGMPYVPQPSYSCPGFDVCTANTDDTLGPVFVTEGP